MKVGVWDTFVTKNDGSTMHFDIIVPEGVAEFDTSIWAIISQVKRSSGATNYFKGMHVLSFSK